MIKLPPNQLYRLVPSYCPANALKKGTESFLCGVKVAKKCNFTHHLGFLNLNSVLHTSALVCRPVVLAANPCTVQFAIWWLVV